MNKNRWMSPTKKEYEKDGMIYKELECGCIFGNTINSFGYHNHYCSEHAPKKSW